MRLPRDVSGEDLARRLRVLGYEITRQTGSHMRLTTQEGGEHHVTIPDIIHFVSVLLPQSWLTLPNMSG